MEQQHLRLRIRIVREGPVILGPGRAELLALIQATGSIAAAGRQMGMSYKRAWVLVDALNALFLEPLVEASRGGPGGGGARLTLSGVTILELYQTVEQDCRGIVAAHLERLQSLLAVSSEGKSG